MTLLRRHTDIPEDLQSLRTRKKAAEGKGKGETKELKEGLTYTWNNLKRNGDPGETAASQSVLEFLWDLAGILFFSRNQPKPDNKVLRCIQQDDKQALQLQKNLSLGPPPSSQWGNNISWWLSGQLEKPRVVRGPQWKCFRFCLAFPEEGQNPSGPLKRREKKKKFQKFTLKWKQTSQ